MNHCLVNFGPVTDEQMQSDAQEPTVNKHNTFSLVRAGCAFRQVGKEYQMTK